MLAAAARQILSKHVRHLQPVIRGGIAASKSITGTIAGSKDTLWACRKSGSAAIDKRAGRKRLAVDHINLELLQEHGYFDMPIQVPPEPCHMLADSKHFFRPQTTYSLPHFPQPALIGTAVGMQLHVCRHRAWL